MKLPSKELLSEVLNNKLELGDIDRYYLIKDERHLLRLILTDKTDCWNYDINIYELAHKCKEWAFLNDYEIITRMRIPNIYIDKHKIDYGYEINHINNGLVKASWWINTEPEAVFRACELLLEQIKCGS